MTDRSTTPRLLPRASREIAPAIWDLTTWARGADPSVLVPLCGHTFYVPLPSHLPDGAFGRIACALPADSKLVVAATGDELQARRGGAFKERLAQLNRSSCEAVMLDDTSPGEIKAGGPFHRLSQFRDAGLVHLFFVAAPDYATAEWMLHHTPAHAVCIPFGLRDQSAKYRLLEDARNFGTGVVARPVQDAVWNPDEPLDSVTDLAFVAAEPTIASTLVPVELALEMTTALNTPMASEQHARWWARFQEAVPPPPMPVRNLPPEFG